MPLTVNKERQHSCITPRVVSITAHHDKGLYPLVVKDYEGERDIPETLDFRAGIFLFRPCQIPGREKNDNNKEQDVASDEIDEHIGCLRYGDGRGLLYIFLHGLVNLWRDFGNILNGLRLVSLNY